VAGDYAEGAASRCASILLQFGKGLVDHVHRSSDVGQCATAPDEPSNSDQCLVSLGTTHLVEWLVGVYHGLEP
jgi:hypothetical protein